MMNNLSASEEPITVFETEVLLKVLRLNLISSCNKQSNI